MLEPMIIFLDAARRQELEFVAAAGASDFSSGVPAANDLNASRRVSYKTLI
jgi:hypothetical protein